VARPGLEVADIFRAHGAAWRRANAGHVSLGQLKAMSAIERCRTAALGGHVARCEGCAHTQVAFNSCRSRSCPKCQASAARKWLAEREAELLDTGYFHLVFTLPATVADIAWQNKEVVYDILFKAAAETVLTIAADPRHLGARIGITAVLHTWGSAMTHHPHIHMIVPGGGLSADGERWVACRPGFFLPVRVLSRLFRRLFLTMLATAHVEGRLAFFGALEALAVPRAFAAFVKRQRRVEWVTYAKAPFAGPKQVLAYLALYTHRIAISNRRLIRSDADGVTFTYKDYRVEGPGRFKTMTLATHEFIRRFLMHVPPKGFHRIRHYGLLANGNRKAMVAKARERLAMAPREAPVQAATGADTTAPKPLPCCCPRCGGRMIITMVFVHSWAPDPRAPPAPIIRLDTS
jgi:putative transposase/transposase-like zinc-binding protein